MCKKYKEERKLVYVVWIHLVDGYHRLNQNSVLKHVYSKLILMNLNDNIGDENNND